MSKGSNKDNEGQKSKIDKNIIRVPVNNYFRYDKLKDDDFNNECSHRDDIKNIYNKGLCKSLDESDLHKFKNVNIFSFRKNINKDRNAKNIIYKVDKNENGVYYIQTGLYIGKLFLKTKSKKSITLEINSGYDKNFENHMLNYASNIFFKDEFKGKGIKNNDNQSFLHTLFFMRLKKVLAIGNPVSIKRVNRKEINIKGKVNLKKYLRNEIYSDYKISTLVYGIKPEQEIVDIIYKTLFVMHKDKNTNMPIDFLKYEKELNTMYSGKNITSRTFQMAYKSKILKNPMYSGYKGVLQIAEMILRNKNIVLDDENDVGISGYLIDISELWEVYLQKLLENNDELRDYRVIAQNTYTLYKGRFYETHNFPDILLENRNGDIVAVLDAKFKTMTYSGKDVDREDLHQIHSYSFYQYLNHNDKFKFSSLVYPTNVDNEKNNDNDITSIFGLENITYAPKFKILTISIPKVNNLDEMKSKEKEFVNNLIECIEEN